MTFHNEILKKHERPLGHPSPCSCVSCQAKRHSPDCSCVACQTAEFEDFESPYRRRKRRRRHVRKRRPVRRRPVSVRQLVRRAIRRGVRDERRLTDMVFFRRHPKLPKGYRIKKGQKKLTREWISIRNSIVRPLLRAVNDRRKKIRVRPVNITYYHTPTTTKAATDDDYYITEEQKFSIINLKDEALPKAGAINQSRTPRKLSQIDSVVLHQMAFSRGAKLRKYLKVTAHYIIMSDGKIGQLHAHSTYLNASNGFNRRSVAIEFAGNFPDINGRYWKPKDKTTWMRNVVTQQQINAGRYLLKHLKKKIPNLRFVYSHRQSKRVKSNDPGPDIWRGVGEYAIRKLGYDSDSRDHVAGTGRTIPIEWR